MTDNLCIQICFKQFFLLEAKKILLTFYIGDLNNLMIIKKKTLGPVPFYLTLKPLKKCY